MAGNSVARPRRIAVVTVGRSDFSILTPLCRMLDQAPDFELMLWAGGAHFDPASGMTIGEIEASGLTVSARFDAGEFSHDQIGAARGMAAQLAGFGRIAADAIAAGGRPDLVLILGDRFEAIAAGLAMVPFGIPVGHISGGSITEGAMDDMFRHALTKLSALHFCDIPEFAARINQMGEEPWRIFVTGALGLDGIRTRSQETLGGLSEAFGFDGLQEGYVLSTLHPETINPERTPAMARAMIGALEASGRQVIYTYPNADPGSDTIIAEIEAAAARLPGHFVVRNLGARWFYSAMAHSGMMVGNSSSGIYEAASFGLPAVDIGDRQKGRFHGANVLHSADDPSSILAAIERAEAMRPEIADMTNPYGDGHGAERVIAALRNLDWDRIILAKRFVSPLPGFSGTRIEPT